MPIEIKELHIRVELNAPSPGQPPGAAPAAPADRAGTPDAGEKETIVAECVEQVLQILHNKMER